LTKIDEILREALKMYKPTPSEEEILKRVSEKIVREAILESSRYEGILDVTLEGSAAKETWVRGREEVDIFIHFDPTVALETLEKTVIELGFKVLRKLDGNPRLMYADHPYVEGRLGNVIVNIVACYKVNPPNWISATDRTPYHTKYVKEKLDQNARDEVRLLKAFMMCCGVYGAEIKMRGFSGYLAELLIINYGGFMETLREASNWIPPVVIDIEKHYKSKEEVLDVFGERHLIVVDPVDRMRNVASAVSEEKFSEFILASKLFSRSPSISFFKPREEIISKTSTIRGNGERCIVIVYFKLSSIKPPDVLWGELKKTENGLKKYLESSGFTVYRSDSWTDEENICLIAFELPSLTLPYVKIHQGPPVHNPNVLQFIDKWIKNEDRIAGPWISGTRLYILRRNNIRNVVEIIRKGLSENRVAVSKGLAEDLRKAEIYTSIEEVGNTRARKFLELFLDGRPAFLDRYEG